MKTEAETRKELIDIKPIAIPQGIRGLFTPAEINEILELTKKVAA